jgi:hypothetical protein
MRDHGGTLWGRHLPASRSLGARIPQPQNSVSRNTAVILKSASEVRLAGLLIVRTTWITAILVCVLAILSGFLSGTDGRDSSQRLPGFAFTDGGDSSWRLPEFALFEPAAPVVGGGMTKTAAPQDDRAQRAKEQAPGDSYSNSGVPHRSGSQPKDAGGRVPVVTPRPKPPQAPSETNPEPLQTLSVTRPKPPQAPSVTLPNPPQAPSVTLPNPPQAPSVTPVPSQPPVSVTVSAPVQTPVTVANNSVGLP